MECLLLINSFSFSHYCYILYLLVQGMSTEIKCECLDILCDVLHKYGNLMASDHEPLLGALLPQLSSNQATVRKKTVSCIGKHKYTQIEKFACSVNASLIGKKIPMGLLMEYSDCDLCLPSASLASSLSDDLLAKATGEVLRLLKNRASKSEMARTNIQMSGALRFVFRCGFHAS